MSEPQIAQLNHIDRVRLSLAFTYSLWIWTNLPNSFMLMCLFIQSRHRQFSICAEHANQSIFKVSLKAFAFKMFVPGDT